MNYIYDIYLNLNKTLYDFFEWNKSDNLLHIKKIPLFIIDSDKFKSTIKNQIKVDTEFIKKISNKAETWTCNKKLFNCVLFSDYSDIIAIEFDNKGNSIKKSFLYIDEEAEILEEINKYNTHNINFKIIKKNQCILKTRKQIKIDNFIDNELKNIDLKRLNYISYECLGTADTDIKKLKNLSNSKNLYNILKLTSKGSK